MDKMLLKPEEAARVLSLGRSTVYLLMASGELASVQVGRARRVPARAIAEYVERLCSEGQLPS
jgi:excisionase family DNA binding protein